MSTRAGDHVPTTTPLCATTALGAAAGEGGVAPLPRELDALAASLRAAANACDDAATRVVPAGARDESICSRYDRAADDWPVVPPPSRERLAALLTTLHDAGTTARQAAALCEQAKRSLEAALRRADEASQDTPRLGWSA